MQKDSVVETNNLVKKYDGKVVVNNLNLCIGGGEVFGFLGPNGAGKTTTIKMLMGLVQPDSGTGKICGFDIVHQVLDVRRSCGVLPDPAGFYDNLTARRVLHFYGELYDMRGKELDEKVVATLKRVGLENAMDMKIGKYSKGMKQRFGLAQTFIHDPQVLIFDEPTAGIDPQGAEDYRGLVKEMKGKGKTIFMTSHILPEVEAVCDRIGIIVNGEMKICGNVDELVNQYTKKQGFQLKLRVKELDEPHTMETLKPLNSVSNIVKNDGYYLVNSSDDVSEDVSRAICNAHGIITELEVYRPSLNEIFLDITKPREPA